MAVALVAVGGASLGAQSTVATTSTASTAPAAAARRAQLDDLFTRLEACRSADEASRLEDRLFEIWSKSGDSRADSLFNLGLVALSYRDYAQAETYFTGAVDRAPEFVEAWNKLASVHYLQGEYDEALRAADHTLMLERRHYGALAGRGMVLMALGDDSAALTSFELALSVNPASPTIQKNVERLRDRLGFRSAD